MDRATEVPRPVRLSRTLSGWLPTGVYCLQGADTSEGQQRSTIRRDTRSANQVIPGIISVPFERYIAMSSEASASLLRSEQSSGACALDRFDRFRTRVAARLGLGLYAELIRYGLVRDLRTRVDQPIAKIPICVRRLQDDDLASVFADSRTQSPSEKKEIAWRIAFFEKGARNGFVAIDQRTGAACHIEWLFNDRDNHFLQTLKGFPPLQADQALIENVYTPPAYRRLGIMSQAMAMIAERAGAREVFTFIPRENTASLKGAERAGFRPRLLHRSLRVGFGMIRSDTFDRLSDPD
jgi:RimJ/RimL family protein N-acetyltransferase